MREALESVAFSEARLSASSWRRRQSGTSGGGGEAARSLFAEAAAAEAAGAGRRHSCGEMHGTASSAAQHADYTDAAISEASEPADDEHQNREADVCIPLKQPRHTRVNGIDFDELEEFAQRWRESLRANVFEGNSYSPFKYEMAAKNEARADDMETNSSNDDNLKQESDSQIPTYGQTGVTFGMQDYVEHDSDFDLEMSAGMNNESFGTDASDPRSWTGFKPRERFAFFSSDSEPTVHATDIPSLVSEGQTFEDLFHDGKPTWWLDCSCPSDDEMRCLVKTFAIHPLTAEDIRLQETREKVELFKSYYFVCFHTFDNDRESEEFLEPINVYMIVFRTGILSFHFSPISHTANVRRRVRQLRDYVNVNSDWICYALIDDITDSFAPVIRYIEYEADSIEDSVFLGKNNDFSGMLRRVGESRRKTMTLMRLLSGKADVIKMFIKRCNDEVNGIRPALTSDINIAMLQGSGDSSMNYSPRGDIALYLGDIQDHLLTMFQNLLAYEKIFSRSHSNYLAQLQTESFYTNNRITELLGRVTVIGTMLVPLNVITGLFGMNVQVPGQNAENLKWWFSIMGLMIAICIAIFFISSFWIRKIGRQDMSSVPTPNCTKSIISGMLPNYMTRSRVPDRRRNSDAASAPSRLSRYD